LGLTAWATFLATPTLDFTAFEVKPAPELELALDLLLLVTLPVLVTILLAGVLVVLPVVLVTVALPVLCAPTLTTLALPPACTEGDATGGLVTEGTGTEIEGEGGVAERAPEGAD